MNYTVINKFVGKIVKAEIRTEKKDGSTFLVNGILTWDDDLDHQNHQVTIDGDNEAISVNCSDIVTLRCEVI